MHVQKMHDGHNVPCDFATVEIEDEVSGKGFSLVIYPSACECNVAFWEEKDVPRTEFVDFEVVYKESGDGLRGAFFWKKAIASDYEFSVYGREVNVEDVAPWNFECVLEPYSLLYHDTANAPVKAALKDAKRSI